MNRAPAEPAGGGRLRLYARLWPCPFGSSRYRRAPASAKNVLFDWQKVPKTKCTAKIAGVLRTPAERIRKTTLFAHSFRAQSLRSPLYPQFSQCILLTRLWLCIIRKSGLKEPFVVPALRAGRAEAYAPRRPASKDAVLRRLRPEKSVLPKSLARRRSAGCARFRDTRPRAFRDFRPNYMGQWAVDSGQWAVDSGQWIVGSGQWAGPVGYKKVRELSFAGAVPGRFRIWAEITPRCGRCAPRK